MSTEIAFSLYIPYVYKNITEEMIVQTFYRKKVGSVVNVDLFSAGEKYNKAHVYFESMYPFGKGAEQMRQIEEGKSVKFQYSRNEHTYWILMKNTKKYDGFSRKGWYDVELENELKALKQEESELNLENEVWLRNGCDQEELTGDQYKFMEQNYGYDDYYDEQYKNTEEEQNYDNEYDYDYKFMEEEQKK